jgi:hypothetical protein
VNTLVKQLNALPTVGYLAVPVPPIGGAKRSAEALLTQGVVGAGGVEPPAPSVSGGSGTFEEPGDAPPCFTAPQMAGPIGDRAVVYREVA